MHWIAVRERRDGILTFEENDAQGTLITNILVNFSPITSDLFIRSYIMPYNNVTRNITTVF